MDQKVPVRQRRVRDRLCHTEVPLQTYERLWELCVRGGEGDSQRVYLVCLVYLVCFVLGTRQTK